MNEYTLIIPAAGKGTRMGASYNKLFLTISGVPIIIRTLRKFEQDEKCKKIVLVINFQEKEIFAEMIEGFGIKKPITFIQGGQERQESVYQGLLAEIHTSYVLIHDGARPFVTQEVIHRVLAGAIEEGASTCGVPVKDTIKKVENGIATETMDRSLLWSIQTPQGFLHQDLLYAHQRAQRQGFFGTDDASLIEMTGKPVRVVMGDYTNIKVTTPEDLIVATSFLATEKRS